MRIKYEQARADFEYLETITEFSDQVEYVEFLEGLLEDPTKKRAATIYCDKLAEWFRQERSLGHTYQFDEQLDEIMERHGEEW